MAEKDQLPTVLPLSRVGRPAAGPGAREEFEDPTSSGVADRNRLVGALSNDLWAPLLEALPAHLLVVDEQRRVAFVNGACRNLLDAPLSSFVGVSVGRLLSSERLEAARRVLSERSGAHSYRDVLRWEEIELHVTVEIELLESQGRELLLLVLHDRTAERRERFERHGEDGVKWVSEPPSARVHQAQHFEVLGLLTGTLAHDFANLLAVILGSLESAQKKLDRGLDVRADLERARLAAERSVETTNDVLHYSRRRELPRRGVDPVEVLTELRGLMERALDPNGHLELRVEPCPSVHVEVAQLETSLLNLIVNAKDALGAEGVVVVRCRPRELSEEEASSLGVLPGAHVVFSVADDGAGMSAEVQQKAFEPFFTTKPEGSGTGLGLSTVRAFVRKSGGAVTLHSSEGQGTTVEFLLPAH